MPGSSGDGAAPCEPSSDDPAGPAGRRRPRSGPPGPGRAGRGQRRRGGTGQAAAGGGGAVRAPPERTGAEHVSPATGRSARRAAGRMRRTLVVTNDFPPRPGGIQAFVHSLAVRQPADEVVVYAPAWHGAPGFDARQPFPVVRHPTSLMLPVPDVLRRARQVARAEGCDRVWFGAAAPLGLLAR